jgi:hypothetical protein
MFQVKKNRSSCHLAVNVMLFFASQISDEETLENRLLFTSASRQNKPIWRHAGLARGRGASIGRPICMWPIGWPATRTRTPPQELVSRTYFLLRGLPQFAFAAFTVPKLSLQSRIQFVPSIMASIPTIDALPMI